jgi:hypothetical protein
MPRRWKSQCGDLNLDSTDPDNLKRRRLPRGNLNLRSGKDSGKRLAAWHTARRRIQERQHEIGCTGEGGQLLGQKVLRREKWQQFSANHPYMAGDAVEDIFLEPTWLSQSDGSGGG